MTTELQPIQAGNLQPRLPPVPWRDPHTVSPDQLQCYIRDLEKACADNPDSADLRTCLGMAHAMNFDVYRSMDALEDAIRVDSGNFFAQLKYAELFYRIRGLQRAERETLKALELAGNAWEMHLARQQLQAIRTLWRNGTQKPEWRGELLRPALALAAFFLIVSLVLFWKT